MSKPIADKNDERKGIIVALFILVLGFIYLQFVTFVMADPPPKDIPLTATVELPKEITLKSMKIEGGGSGKPTDAPKKETPQDQTQKVITKEKSETTQKTGESNHSTSTHNPDNEASTTKVAPNPFGSGGSGGGDGGGNGKGFGKDDGDGAGPGKGEGSKPRIRLNDPNTEGIQSDQNCKIFLKLTINAEGDVMKGENIVAKTTTTNQIVINQVISNVKSQVKFNKKEGAAPEIVYLTVNLAAK
jgi:hypothetical protein